MNEERIKKLLAYRAEDPQDPFPVYALGLEYKALDAEKSAHYFDELLNNHPTYLGGYYHAAEVYHQLGMTEKAEDAYQKGIALAKECKDQHALSELQNAYMNFQIEE